MPVYTVHAADAGRSGTHAGDRVAFVRDGFHFWAFLFGPLWLAWHRLWLALLGWIVVMIALDLAIRRVGAGSAATSAVDLLVALLMGLEASTLARWTLSRRNWRQIDMVVADDEEAAERRFFDRCAEKQREGRSDQPSVDRGGPPPTREVPGQAFSRPPQPDGIIGLFPEPGATR